MYPPHPFVQNSTKPGKQDIDKLSLVPLLQMILHCSPCTPPFFKLLWTTCCDYTLKWRYEFNHPKSGTVTFGEDKQTHCTRMNERECKLGLQNIYELYEYKNLGVTKNYIGSSVSVVNDNIEKTRKKAGMIFSSNSDRRKVNSLIHVKF